MEPEDFGFLEPEDFGFLEPEDFGFFEPEDFGFFEPEDFGFFGAYGSFHAMYFGWLVIILKTDFCYFDNFPP